MKIKYVVEIQNPSNHFVKVTMFISDFELKEKLQIFLPSWSPGSYLMREYSRHVRSFQVSQTNGETLFYQQIKKGVWEVDWAQSNLNKKWTEFNVSYDIYCKEVSVRTSYVDATHAFLHGPSYLMGLIGQEVINPQIEFRFPPAWSKISTSLKEISKNREEFIFEAANYDELIDCPVEIGCHETDGFEALSKPHHLAFYGQMFPHDHSLKDDIKKIVLTVARHFENELPYDQYLFINHFLPKIYGGLEHLNSTALQFDGRKLSNRKDYLSYLSLVAHEYFHLWNVKRIRPVELGPFDYLNEGYSTMLWLAEGLTSFMDDLFVYRSGLSSLEEYLEALKGNLDVYFSTPGRKFHSLEQSSFNAWIKLYRPDENSKNSSISYYLKGGLVFLVLHAELLKKGKSINDLLLKLWNFYKKRPENGISKAEFFLLLEDLAGKATSEYFSVLVETQKDIDFDTVFRNFGLEIKWHRPTTPWLGIEWDFSGERVFVKSISLDSPAFKSGINSGDEILFINHQRILRDDVEKLASMLMIDKSYEFFVSRLGRPFSVDVIPEMSPQVIKEIGILDRSKAEKSFL